MSWEVSPGQHTTNDNVLCENYTLCMYIGPGWRMIQFGWLVCETVSPSYKKPTVLNTLGVLLILVKRLITGHYLEHYSGSIILFIFMPFLCHGSHDWLCLYFDFTLALFISFGWPWPVLLACLLYHYISMYRQNLTFLFLRECFINARIILLLEWLKDRLLLSDSNWLACLLMLYLAQRMPLL